MAKVKKAIDKDKIDKKKLNKLLESLFKNEKLNRLIESLLENTFIAFFKELNVYNLYLADFLNSREKKNYRIYVLLRATTQFSSLIAILLYIFGDIAFSLPVAGISASIYGILKIRMEQLFKYSYSKYKKSKKNVINHRNQLDLLLDNNFLNLEILKNQKKSKYQQKFEEINKNVNRFGNILKPTFIKLKEIGLIGVLAGFMIRIIYDLLIQISKSNEQYYYINFSLDFIYRIAFSLIFISVFLAEIYETYITQPDILTVYHGHYPLNKYLHDLGIALTIGEILNTKHFTPYFELLFITRRKDYVKIAEEFEKSGQDSWYKYLSANILSKFNKLCDDHLKDS